MRAAMPLTICLRRTTSRARQQRSTRQMMLPTNRNATRTSTTVMRLLREPGGVAMAPAAMIASDLRHVNAALARTQAPDAPAIGQAEERAAKRPALGQGASRLADQGGRVAAKNLVAVQIDLPGVLDGVLHLLILVTDDRLPGVNKAVPVERSDGCHGQMIQLIKRPVERGDKSADRPGIFQFPPPEIAVFRVIHE